VQFVHALECPEEAAIERFTMPSASAAQEGTSTTRKQKITDGQKPSGKGGKPSGVLFLTVSRQEHADRSPVLGKVHFS